MPNRIKFEGLPQGWTFDPAKYAHLVELGTAPHVIPFGVIAGKPRYGIKHPGARPRRFLRRAFQATNRQSIRLFSEKLAAETAIEAAKARGRLMGVSQ